MSCQQSTFEIFKKILKVNEKFIKTAADAVLPIPSEVLGKIVNEVTGILKESGNNLIGPKTLKVGDTHSGRIVSLGEQKIFVPHRLKHDKIVVELEERDGKGEVTIDICEYNPQEDTSKVVETWRMNDTNKEKKDTNGKRVFIRKGVKGKLYAVSFKGHSPLGTLAYDLTVQNPAA